MNSFDKQNNRGKIAESAVKAHLESRGNKVIDVSLNPDYQKVDTDFIVISPSGQRTTLEVKLDRGISKYGNFFFEAGSMRGNFVSEGWLTKSKAEYICFYDDKTKEGYIIDFTMIKEDLEKIAQPRTYYDYMDNKTRGAMLLSIHKAQKYIVHSWKGEK